MSKNAMIVAGVMSGTSADGIDTALVQIAEPNSRGRVARSHTIKLLGHRQVPYPASVRASILAAMNADRASVADLARLNFLLGELYADAVLAMQRRFHVKANLVGCHDSRSPLGHWTIRASIFASSPNPKCTRTSLALK